MEFLDLIKAFTEEQKIVSFLYLQNYLLEKTENKEKFFIGRLSGNECNLCGKRLTKSDIPIKLLFGMLTGAGIQMMTDKDIDNYVDLYIKSCRNISILSVWDSNMYIQAKPYYDF